MRTVITGDGATSGGNWQSDSITGNNGGAVNAFGGGTDWENPNPNIYPKVALTSCSFTRCQATGDGIGNGGAICCWYGELTLDSCTFSKCSCSSDGGGVCCQDGELIAKKCQFTECSSQREGGAVAALWQGQYGFTAKNTAVFIGCTVDRCVTTGRSVLYFYNLTSLELTGNTVTDCNSSECVLTIWCQTMKFDSNTINLFVQNASGYALGIEVADRKYEFTNSHFSNNQCEIDRFLKIKQETGSWTFTNCEFTSISTQGEGTAISLQKRQGDVISLKLVDCNFTRLSCKDNGGAIHLKRVTRFDIQGCIFEDCESQQGWIGGDRVVGAAEVFTLTSRIHNRLGRDVF